ncbi:hypothetical protein B0J18DRAFT_84362 [Chaetomium sp. MPI-SDFR-AT-0129]|nr:hypothetical protein B0J18DRAFT_84362 [Chaetomium sp. MPI-SDFR-AT-0129]
MCHGHPHYHSCGHQSVTWHYCPSALIDLETGYETPCPSITFATSQSSTTACPLANCDFRSTGTQGWTCCKCGGRNDSGWCKNVFAEPKWNKNPITNEWEWMERCDHGCCRNCAKDTKAGSKDASRKDTKGGKESRKRRQNGSQISDADPVMTYTIKFESGVKEANVAQA